MRYDDEEEKEVRNRQILLMRAETCLNQLYFLFEQLGLFGDEWQEDVIETMMDIVEDEILFLSKRDP